MSYYAIKELIDNLEKKIDKNNELLQSILIFLKRKEISKEDILREIDEDIRKYINK